MNDEWLPAVQASLRETTFHSYRRELTAHVLPRLGSVRLQQLGPEHLNRLYSELLADGRANGSGGLSPRTVRYVHTIMRRALRDATRWGRTVRNAADSAQPPKAHSPEMSTWSATDLRAFLEHVRGDRLQALFVLAATTGMRRGELLGLRWTDLDLERRQLAVRQAVVCVVGRPRLSEPKTERGRRVIDLDGATVSELRAHRARQAEERLAWGSAYQDNGIVFCREDGTLLHPQQLSTRFRRLARQASLPPIRLHDLRHTYATLALEAGVRVEVVSRRLGHSTTSMTSDIYTHAVPALQRQEAERVAALIFGAETAPLTNR